MTERYLIPSRLEDVLMLIQMFGIGDFQRGNEPLKKEIGPPRSNPGGTWTEVVSQHPEFFRVDGKSEMLCLAIRYITPHPHPAVELTVVELLMKAAIDLHEAEVRRLERTSEREERSRQDEVRRLERTSEQEKQSKEHEARRKERRAVLYAALIAGFSAIVANFIAALLGAK